MFCEAVPEGAEVWIIGLMSRSSRPQVVQVLPVLAGVTPTMRSRRPLARRLAAPAASRVRS